MPAQRASKLLLKLFKDSEHIAAMICGVNFFEDVGTFAILINDKGCAFNAPILFTVFIFLLPHARGLSDSVVGIG